VITGCKKRAIYAAASAAQWQRRDNVQGNDKKATCDAFVVLSAQRTGDSQKSSAREVVGDHTSHTGFSRYVN